jgi:hypothetical protein
VRPWWVYRNRLRVFGFAIGCFLVMVGLMVAITLVTRQIHGG